MGLTRTGLAVVGIVAGLLQLILAPAMSIGGFTPNFMVAATIAIIALSGEESHCVFAFVMGLIFDLIAGMPVGNTSIGLLACALLVPMAIATMGNDTIIRSLVLVLSAIFAFQLVSGILLSVAGLMSPTDTLIYYIFPGTIYNTVICAVVYLIALRSGQSTRPRSSGMTMTNIRFS